MPWKETCTMNERNAFIEAWLQPGSDISLLCRRFHIARKTGYKWINRFKAEGLPGLADRSRADSRKVTRPPRP